MAADNRAPSHMRTGLFYAIITYLMWGMLPLYFNLMADASPVEIVASRVVFSLIFCAALLPMLKLTGGFVEVLRNRRATLVLFAASLLIGVNWFIYVLATTTGRTIDASLGYFINPLVSVSLGVIFLKERLRVAQWVAVGLSAVAVLIMSVVYGQVPFIGLGLAFSFGIYGLLKSRVGGTVAPVVSLSLETLLLIPVALLALVWVQGTGQSTMFTTPGRFLLLASTGVVTAVPLIAFAAAAKRLPLTVIGMVQYLGPSIQFFLAVFVLKDHIGAEKWLGLSIIWVALVIFTADAVRASRTSRLSRTADPETGMVPIVQRGE
ncbi:MAG: EamA family transporter RarD [Rothia sp. (in: high G+C Gram-positive bacteria)]|uniref:EamA family transporter RarD n=1 Tax=Rothia sp. (in: high G+C Gram-positive bacteria) TaxID=1885016 RepID=UPI0026DBFEC0|nr:EamA family transporter RarD [Rothia sp. (in: high G+C Gram-positive bacteria)]MDO4885073.1 EamA family transporter RarD [Rothia sp. (in: high G+C Gram-positive bacteria)]